MPANNPQAYFDQAITALRRLPGTEGNSIQRKGFFDTLASLLRQLGVKPKSEEAHAVRKQLEQRMGQAGLNLEGRSFFDKAFSGDTIGGLAKKAAPIMSFVPGIGWVAAAGTALGGSLLAGDSAKDTIKNTALAGVSGYGIDKFQAARAAGSAGGSAASSVAAAKKAKLGGAVANAAMPAAQGAGVASGAAGNILSRAWGAAKDNPELVLGGISAIERAFSGAEGDRLRDEQLGYQRDDRAARIALEDKIRAQLEGLKMEPVDLGHLFTDPGNPYWDRRQPVVRG